VQRSARETAAVRPPEQARLEPALASAQVLPEPDRYEAAEVAALERRSPVAAAPFSRARFAAPAEWQVRSEASEQ
jgi:hypothetical protein